MEKVQAFHLVKNGAAKQAFQQLAITLAAPQQDEVQVEVSAFGLNYADVMARRGLYRECPPLPAVLGYEVVGVICAVGDQQNKDLIGKRVVAFTRFGGYAQKVNTKVSAIVEIGTMDEGEALCLATQYVTAYYMTHYVTNVFENETVLVHAAAGGVGTALVQLLQLKKVRIIAKTGSERKVDYLKDLGVEEVINYRKTDYVKRVNEILNGERLAVSFNPIAGSTFKKDKLLLGAGGRLVLFGGSERSGKRWGIFSTLNFVWKMGLIIPIGLMMRSKSVIGVNMLKVGDYHPEILGHCLKQVVELAQANKIHPQVGGVYQTDQLAAAHDFLESGKSFGKIIVKW